METKDMIILGPMIILGWIIPSLVWIGYGRTINSKMAWKITTTGLITPWVIGSVVKLYLESIGKVTLPWSYFLNPKALTMFIPATIWWGLPFILLAFMSRYLLKKDLLGIHSNRGKFLLLMGTLIGAFIGAAKIFISVFWLFDAVIILVPVWTLYFSFLLTGLAIGWLLARRADAGIHKIIQ